MLRGTSIRRLLVTGLVTSAALPAAAHARFEVNAPSAGPPAHLAPAVQPPSARAGAESNGFQWADAAIGATGAVVLLSVGAGGTTAVRRRRGSALHRDALPAADTVAS
jgi:hypothetical protein